MKRIRCIIYESCNKNMIFSVEDDNLDIKDYTYSDIIGMNNQLSNATMKDGTLFVDHNVERINIWNTKDTGGKLIKMVNDLYTYCHKNNKLEWLEFYNNAKNELGADEICFSSNRTVNVKCTHCGYKRKLMLNTFCDQRVACPACQSKNHSKCMPGSNDFYTMCIKEEKEQLLKEYIGEDDVKNIGYRSHKVGKWRCQYGHEWEATFDKRFSGSGCPQCKGEKTSIAERAICNWLKENNINIIERGKICGEEFDINIVDYNILIEVNSEYTHGSIENIEKDKRKIEIAKKLNKNLIVVMQNCSGYANGRLHYDISFNSNRKDYMQKLIKELSSKLEEYSLNIEGSISKRAESNAHVKEVPFERSLAGVYSDIEKYWSDKNAVSPKIIYAKSRKYITLICKKHNNEYSVRADSLSNTYINNRGCQYCEGKIPVKGENDLLTVEPDICKDWSDKNDNSPDEYTVHSNAKVYWKCNKCGNEWIAMINSRTGVNRTGCPICNRYKY